ncbi:GNAT family N-acetyltransferase [Streptomyces sp. WM6378]|uniref:GNAT family N-acetyltransferase n=1 Tax=Streptomyces sp. WM6378 TaxID=1415557 RepID=UPI0006BF36DC|nr:GNAT family protein [Streptomyces sp. WM6378]KOU36225.1 hypothetical protein ADK54_34900 [Streptomyces sp. WM6378]
MSATAIRPLSIEDSEALAVLHRQNREFLRPWDPPRSDEFFTEVGQRASVAAALRQRDNGAMWPGVVLYEGAVVGRVDLNNILLGRLRSCFIGYWISSGHNGRGIATDAVALALNVAFHDLQLHRVDAFAREDNPASCRVLKKCGFRTVGVSRGHIHIDGRWRDDVFFQKLAPWDDRVRLMPDAGGAHSN